MQCAVVEIVPMDKLVCTGMVLFHFILQSGIYSSSIQKTLKCGYTLYFIYKSFLNLFFYQFLIFFDGQFRRNFFYLKYCFQKSNFITTYMNQKRKRVTSIYCQYIKIVFRLKIFCSRQGSSIRGKVHQLRSRLVHPMRGVIFWRTSFRTNDDNMGTCSCSYLEPKQSKNMIALSFLCTKLKSSTIYCAKFQNRKTGAYFLQETRI